jgi:hypothetical protein
MNQFFMMLRLPAIIIVLFFLHACSNKEKMPSPTNPNEFPSNPTALPASLNGKWIRTTSLRTFDYKPDEWVTEPGDSSSKKFLQLNADKTYSSNRINCSDCKIELLRDTLYVKHSDGFYKFPVLLLNDSLLYLKTKIDQPGYSLPNTGLFDFILEEKYQKLK